MPLNGSVMQVGFPRLSVMLLLAVLLMSIVVERSNTSEQLTVTVFTDKQAYGPSELVTITGQVLDGSMQGVSLASVSIQANDPLGNPIHVALVISEADGGYSDQFTTPSGPVNGAYSVYVTATKPGYGTASGQIVCTIIPEFPAANLLWIILLLTLVLSLTLGRRKRELS